MAHGDTLNVPVEVQEVLNPLMVEAIALRQDSGGDGSSRGGLGTEKVVRVLTDCNISVQIDRTLCPPWGADGGLAAEPGDASVEHKNGKVRRVIKGTVPLEAGDRFRLKTGGGGGFGCPINRDPYCVANDISTGYLSEKKAKDIYGVFLDEKGDLDRIQTKAARAAMDQN